jgi:hypothetical protein
MNEINRKNEKVRKKKGERKKGERRGEREKRW